MTNERRQSLIARIEELQEQQSSHWAWEEISLYTWLAWRDSRRSAGNTDIKRLAFIDSPAQQHEAQADENQKPGKEECVHEWCTEEDYDGEPLFIECIKCGCR